ncbi:hypothetical protein GE09DRAFT_473298 [Coniochaeta sp. 2T2.1]|nr:hypothetical protein GE09DRAFT_473298 [Coniochaeta sp. 2T2.1]
MARAGFLSSLWAMSTRCVSLSLVLPCANPCQPENARQSLTGIDTAQGTNSVIVLRDWADQPSSGTHALDMSGGPSTTPAAAWYMITGMRTPLQNQDALAAAIDAYLRGIFHCGTFSPVFHHVGVSKTDPEMVLSVQGWPSREAAEEYWDVSDPPAQTGEIMLTDSLTSTGRSTQRSRT